MADGRQQFYAEDEGIAGNYLAAELDVVDTKEVGAPALGLFDRIEDEQTASLRHGFNLKHARHHGFLREVSLEELFVGGDVLDGHNIVATRLDHFVHELHGVAVRQELADAVDIHQRCVVGVVVGRLNFVETNLLAHLAGKLVVDGMTRAGSDDSTLDWAADEGHITDNVEQFVARGFVAPYEGTLVEIA